MELKLNTNESEEYFYNALCNGLGYLGGYGLQLDYKNIEYIKSKSRLSNGICFEDVLMQMLKDGYKITIVDVECEGEYTCSIGLEEVHDRVQNTPLEHLLDMRNGDDDATTADVILQTVFFKDVIFG